MTRQRSGKRIDWIFASSGLTVERCAATETFKRSTTCKIKATGWPPSDHYGEAVVVKYQTHSDQEKQLYTSAAKSTVKQQDMMLWPLSALPRSSREASSSNPRLTSRLLPCSSPPPRKTTSGTGREKTSKVTDTDDSQNFRTKERDTLQLNVSFWEKKMGRNWEK